MPTTTEVREALIAELKAMRGPFLGDGFRTIRRDDLVAALSQQPAGGPDLASMTPDARLSYFGAVTRGYCSDCGGEQPIDSFCQCWNDE